MARRRANKYAARKTTVDNITFDSKREAERYKAIKLGMQIHLIRNLRLQPVYQLMCGGRPVLYRSGRYAKYIADFEYEEMDPDTGQWTLQIDDVKGFETTLGKLKIALFEAETGLKVRIVR